MIDGKPRIGDEVYIHGYIDEIRNDVVIVRNEGGYFGTSDREMFYYEEDERGYGTMNEADCKTENNSEIPNNCDGCKEGQEDCYGCPFVKRDEPTISKMEQVDKDINVRSKTEPQTDPCDGCACDDGKHLMYCMNCKGIAWKTEPPKVEDVPKAGMSDMSEIDKMIKMVDGILGDDDLCEGCEYVIEGLSCDECRRKYADKIIKILRSVRKAIKDEPQTDCAWK